MSLYIYIYINLCLLKTLYLIRKKMELCTCAGRPVLKRRELYLRCVIYLKYTRDNRPFWSRTGLCRRSEFRLKTLFLRKEVVRQ